MSVELGDHLDIRPQSERIADMERRNANNAVTALVGYAHILVEYGPKTLPPPWYKRIYWCWRYKLSRIIEVIKE